MNRKLLFVLLLISLAFNLAVISTFTYRYTLHRRVKSLLFNEENKESLEAMKGYRPSIHHKFRKNIEPLHTQNRSLRTEFFQELIKPEPDFKVLEAIMLEIQTVTQEISNNFYEEMIETRKSLTPEEAEQAFLPHLRSMKRPSHLRTEEGETRGFESRKRHRHRDSVR